MIPHHQKHRDNIQIQIHTWSLISQHQLDLIILVLRHRLTELIQKQGLVFLKIINREIYGLKVRELETILYMRFWAPKQYIFLRTQGTIAVI